MAGPRAVVRRIPTSIEPRTVEISDDLALVLSSTGLVEQLRMMCGGERSTIDDSLDAVEEAGRRLVQQIPIAESGNSRDFGSADSSSSKREHLTSSQAAEELGLGERRVRQLCDNGELEAERVGRSWLIRRHDLEDLKQRRSAA